MIKCLKERFEYEKITAIESIQQTKPRLNVNQAAKTTTSYPLLLTKVNKRELNNKQVMRKICHKTGSSW